MLVQSLIKTGFWQLQRAVSVTILWLSSLTTTQAGFLPMSSSFIKVFDRERHRVSIISKSFLSFLCWEWWTWNYFNSVSHPSRFGCLFNSNSCWYVADCRQDTMHKQGIKRNKLNRTTLVLLPRWYYHPELVLILSVAALFAWDFKTQFFCF